ncbi:unnamed protein product [Vitrella brassicaformis CCMP3155]|uniref:MD-2-related lipid-recognition domain-containing protein n=2 Tax=Vitrella brassicaformis TaxID=1169539 RepID=A0A0G4ECQ1_VITBC|nr:unnamed protein product [Vitrella brassicaformis CCMP3155]|eukprot:CEL93087.1 unnamed protein product [Vitrella brassicaformis CCMP3155]
MSAALLKLLGCLLLLAVTLSAAQQIIVDALGDDEPTEPPNRKLSCPKQSALKVKAPIGGEASIKLSGRGHFVRVSLDAVSNGEIKGVRTTSFKVYDKNSKISQKPLGGGKVTLGESFKGKKVVFKPSDAIIADGTSDVGGTLSLKCLPGSSAMTETKKLTFQIGYDIEVNGAVVNEFDEVSCMAIFACKDPAMMIKKAGTNNAGAKQGGFFKKFGKNTLLKQQQV